MNMKNIIVDTDIGPDCDDVGALAMLNIYANRGLCNILGIAHCTSNPYGAGTIDAICKYYGHDDVVVSTYPGKNFLSDEKCMYYNKYITENLANRYKTTQPENAVDMYRRILSMQSDHSVEIVSIGPLNNLSDLLNSEADNYSQLSGIDLVKAKVSRLVSMAGIFSSPVEGINSRTKELIGKPYDDFPEFNVVCDIKAAQNIADNWPTEKVFLGFEAGILETGALLKTKTAETNPVRIAYNLYTENGLRYSWDLLTMEFAVDESCGHFALSEAGKVVFDDIGRTMWTQGKGNDHYVVWAESEKKIVEDIDNLLITKQ